MKTTRRAFLQRTGSVLAAAGVGSTINAPFIQPARGAAPSDTVVVAVIGCRGMGMGDLLHHLNVAGVACGGVCDVDGEVLDRQAAEVEKRTGTRPERYRDFRELLDRKDVDAVIVGSPDHWHCLHTTLACEAGKDVYVEKPMANSIAECDAMVRAARRHGRVVQVGQQQRSGEHWRAVAEFVQSGQLGRIRRIQIWSNWDYGRGADRTADAAPPAGVDYDLWLGPAPRRPFNAGRFHSVWRFHWDYGGGILTDWGVHLLDAALWAMQVEGPPRRTSSVGGLYAYADRAMETPDTQSVHWAFDDYIMTWEHTSGLASGLYDRNYGIAFVGDAGTLVVNRQGWQIYPEVREGRYALEALPPQPGRGSNHDRHAADFIESIRQRKDPACTVEMGRLAALYAHLGNISLRTNTSVVWDDAAGTFVDNPAADALVRPAYREPWDFPAA